MRIPTAAEFFSLIVATGQLSGFSTKRKIVILFFYDLYAADTCRLPFHILADNEVSLINQPPCDRSYKVQEHDTCNKIGASHSAPTSVFLYITSVHFTYTF